MTADAGRRPRAVVLVGGPAAPYSRSTRIARALAAEGFDVEIAAIAAAGLPDGEREPVVVRRYRPSGVWRLLGASDAATGASVTGDRPAAPRRAAIRKLARPLLDLRRWLFWPHAVRGWWAALARELAPADLYHACGSLAIAPALAARRRTRIGPSGRQAVVIYDAIDDVIGSNEAMRWPRWIRRWRARTEAGWARAADARVTVNEVLADRLARRWGVTPPLVLPNVPELPGEAPTRDDSPLRAASGLPETMRLVLFQGRLGPGLGLEAAAEAVLAVPDAALVLLGFGRGYDAERARDAEPRFAGRHVTLPAVPPDDLPAWTAGADLALVPLPPDSPNQRDSTPNKFWEAIAVGVPVVVVRGLRVLEGLVADLDLGVVAASPRPNDLAAAIAAALERLEREGSTWRSAIRRTAADRFAWPPHAEAYRSMVRELRG